MTVLQFVPIVLSLLVLGAHFLRAGNMAWMALSVMLLALLAVRRPWAARVVQVALVLGAVEWVRTLMHLTAVRSQAGMPATRMAIILGAVAAVTLASALIFQTKTMRRRYDPAAPR